MTLTSFACSAFAQSDIDTQALNTERVRLTIDLTDDDFKNLKQYGKLRMRIPEYFQNRVAAIKLRYVDTYLEEKVRLNGEPLVSENASHVTLDGLMLERLRFQPIEIRVFEKNFTEVQINFLAEPQTRVFVANENEGFTDQEFRIQIADRFLLQARIKLKKTLSLATDIGQIEIDWKKVEKITFASAEVSKATVKLITGDKITGLIDLEELDIKTRWGRISIPIEDVKTVLPIIPSR